MQSAAVKQRARKKDVDQIIQINQKTFQSPKLKPDLRRPPPPRRSKILGDKFPLLLKDDDPTWLTSRRIELEVNWLISSVRWFLVLLLIYTSNLETLKQLIPVHWQLNKIIKTRILSATCDLKYPRETVVIVLSKEISLNPDKYKSNFITRREKHCSNIRTYRQVIRNIWGGPSFLGFTASHLTSTWSEA